MESVWDTTHPAGGSNDGKHCLFQQCLVQENISLLLLLLTCPGGLFLGIARLLFLHLYSNLILSQLLYITSTFIHSIVVLQSLDLHCN